MKLKLLKKKIAVAIEATFPLLRPFRSVFTDPKKNPYY